MEWGSQTKCDESYPIRYYGSATDIEGERRTPIEMKGLIIVGYLYLRI